jgi:LDH2 family malate/lactate/ureidoglycolate dehydrogenase
MEKITRVGLLKLMRQKNANHVAVEVVEAEDPVEEGMVGIPTTTIVDNNTYKE